MMGSKKLSGKGTRTCVKHLQPDFVVPVNYLIFICAAIGLRVFLNFQRLFKYEVDTEILIYLVRLLPNIYKLIVDTYFGKGMYIYSQ